MRGLEPNKGQDGNHSHSPNWLNILQFLLEYGLETNTFVSLNCAINLQLLTVYLTVLRFLENVNILSADSLCSIV